MVIGGEDRKSVDGVASRLQPDCLHRTTQRYVLVFPLSSFG